MWCRQRWMNLPFHALILYNHAVATLTPVSVSAMRPCSGHFAGAMDIFEGVFPFSFYGFTFLISKKPHHVAAIGFPIRGDSCWKWEKLIVKQILYWQQYMMPENVICAKMIVSIGQKLMTAVIDIGGWVKWYSARACCLCTAKTKIVPHTSVGS